MNSPWEESSDVLKIIIAQYLSPEDCVMMEMACKRWYNYLSQYQVSFPLKVTLTSFSPNLLLQTGELADLSLKDHKISFCYSPENSNKQFPLCHIATPPNFIEGIKEFSCEFPSISFFTLHGVPSEYSIEGIPGGWFGIADFCGWTNKAVLQGRKLELGMGVNFDFQDQSYQFSIYISPSDLDLVELKIQEMYSNDKSIKEIMQSYPDMDKRKIQKLLNIPEETREEGFARLRPEIIVLKDAAMTDAEIATKLRIPEDLIPEILKDGNSDNQ
jgi:hypothetical protein